MTDSNPRPPGTGIPRWLLIGFAVKLALAIAIVGGVVWWAGR